MKSFYVMRKRDPKQWKQIEKRLCVLGWTQTVSAHPQGEITLEKKAWF